MQLTGDGETFLCCGQEVRIQPTSAVIVHRCARCGAVLAMEPCNGEEIDAAIVEHRPDCPGPAGRHGAGL